MGILVANGMAALQSKKLLMTSVPHQMVFKCIQQLEQTKTMTSIYKQVEHPSSILKERERPCRRACYYCWWSIKVKLVKWCYKQIQCLRCSSSSPLADILHSGITLHHQSMKQKFHNNHKWQVLEKNLVTKRRWRTQNHSFVFTNSHLKNWCQWSKTNIIQWTVK